MVLLEKHLELVPSQTRSNIAFDIEVPEDYDSIVIDATYCPKFISDPELIKSLTLEGGKKYGLIDPETKSVKLCECPSICNMITVSLDINGRFCGYAHRHDYEQHIVISSESATPGFYRTRGEKGIWHVNLAVNNVSSDKCIYDLRVLGVNRGDIE